MIKKKMTKMPHDIIYQGNIVLPIERNELADGCIIDINLLPHCTTCRIDTYDCPHMTTPPGRYSFFVKEKIHPDGRYLTFNAEREKYTGADPYIEIFDGQSGKFLQKIIISSSNNGHAKQE